MKYLDVAIAAARSAGKIHQRYFHSGIKTQEKSSSFDLVTTADIQAEQKIVAIIKKHYPDHNFLAEEQTYRRTGSEYTWIIDPLDGTNNFASGLPIFCASIALAKGNQLLLGVVYDVLRDELFYAQKGQGSFLNRKRIRVSSTDKLKDAILITGFYYDRGVRMLDNLENVKKFFLKRIRGIRRLGSAALDLCYIASARAAGFWEFCLSPWDFAAGKLIIEEAGGKVSDNSGRAVDIYQPSFIVASNAKLHRSILTVLKENNRGK